MKARNSLSALRRKFVKEDRISIAEIIFRFWASKKVRNRECKSDSDTGTRTLVSCVKGKYANHLHHIGISQLNCLRQRRDSFIVILILMCTPASTSTDTTSGVHDCMLWSPEASTSHRVPPTGVTTTRSTTTSSIQYYGLLPFLLPTTTSTSSNTAQVDQQFVNKY